MKINDIDYFVTLLIGDLDSDDLQELYFSDFDEFNSFIEAHKDDPQYSVGPYNYTLVESCDGKPDAFYWNREIQFLPFTKEQILEEIEEQKEFIIDMSTYTNDTDSHMKEIHYSAPNTQYMEKVDRLKDFAYVCPSCLREIDDCRCKSYPFYLVQIDRLMLPIIQELNEKGYKTTGCCAGHPKNNDPSSTSIHICFDKEYYFDEPIPDGAVWSKLKHCISFEPNCSSYDDLLHFQKECLEKLTDWSEMLFELNANEMLEDADLDDIG